MWGRIMEHMSNIQGNMERRYGEGTKTDLDYGKLSYSWSLYLHCNSSIMMFWKRKDTRPHWEVMDRDGMNKFLKFCNGLVYSCILVM